MSEIEEEKPNQEQPDAQEKPRIYPVQCGEPTAQFGEPHAQCGETGEEVTNGD